MTSTLGWRSKVRRAGRRFSENLGLAGLVGAGLLVLAAVLALCAPPLERQAEELRASADQVREQLAEARRRLALRSDASHQTLEVRDRIPAMARASEDVRLVFAAAKKSNIQLSKGEYSLANADDEGRLQRFEIILPVRERYTTIKSFVAEVLRSVPNASLAELRIERIAANVDVLDARIRFRLFYKASRS